jgi:regulator of RNase E activity RraA
MAQIALGIGTSHGPQLSTPPEEWGQRASADRRNSELAFRGADYTFDELRQLRGAAFAAECELDVQRERHARSRAAIDELGRIIRAADIDVLVIISSDHKEIYGDELLPQFAIYWGETMQHEPYTAEQLAGMPPGLAVAEVANQPAQSEVRRGHAALGLHLIREVSKAGFDPGAAKVLPPGRWGNHSIWPVARSSRQTTLRSPRPSSTGAADLLSSRKQPQRDTASLTAGPGRPRCRAVSEGMYNELRKRMLDRLRALDTCAVSDALDTLKLPGATTGIRPLWAVTEPVAGRVRTVQAGPRQDGKPAQHIAAAAIEAAETGDVLVIANGGRTDVSCWGGILTLAARRNGIGGVVIDGACRDIAESAEHGFPVFGRAVVPVSARGRIVQLAMDEPVEFAGIRVHPGDVVFADQNGVVFIPAAELDRVVALAERIVARESAMAEAVLAGNPVTEVMHDSKFPAIEEPIIKETGQ